MTCPHFRTERGPDVPRPYGSWLSEVCRDCGAWRTMTHRVRRLDGTLGPPYHISAWHPASELAEALRQNDDR